MNGCAEVRIRGAARFRELRNRDTRRINHARVTLVAVFDRVDAYWCTNPVRCSQSVRRRCPGVVRPSPARRALAVAPEFIGPGRAEESVARSSGRTTVATPG